LPGQTSQIVHRLEIPEHDKGRAKGTGRSYLSGHVALTLSIQPRPKVWEVVLESV